MTHQPPQPASPPGTPAEAARPTRLVDETDPGGAPEPTSSPPEPPVEPVELASTRVMEILPFQDQDARALPTRPTAAAATPAPTETASGEVVLDDFRLLKKLGEGAMGSVFKASQISYDRLVAVKVLFQHVARNLKLVERFYREARVSGCLDHPNIVAGFGVGESHGWHYFAMEYVDGVSVQDWLDRLGKFTLGDALHIVLACARGLQYAHETGLIHRDIKPANLLLTRRGQVKIADFGMVKYRDEDMALTKTGHGVGTPWYMPLEQARNAKETDHRSDIYALGCVLYCLVTGQPPFTQPTLIEVVQAKELGTFPPARQFTPGVPERLELIIAKMVQKHPRYRYGSCAEVIVDLEGLGLANPRLSFLCAQPSPAATSQSASTAGPTPAPSTPPSGIITNLWYVRYERSDGRKVERKMTTAQILRSVATGLFDASATAAREPTGSFRALPTHREFGHLMLPKAAKKEFDAQTSRYRRLYKEIDEEDQQRRKKLEEERALADRYWYRVAVRVAVALGVLGLGYLGLRFLINNFKAIFF
jgi:serine/threonine-protein kinase